MRTYTLVTAALLFASAATAHAQITISYAPLPTASSQPAAQQTAAPSGSRFVQTGSGIGGAPATFDSRYVAQRPYVAQPPVAATTAPVTYPVAPPITAQPTPASSYVPTSGVTSYAPASQAYYAPAVTSPPSYPVVQAQYATPITGSNGYAVAPGTVPAASVAPTLRTVTPQANSYLNGQQYPVQQVAYDPCTCQPMYSPSIQYVPTSGYVPAAAPNYAYTQGPIAGTQQVAAVPNYAWEPVVALRSLPDEYYVGQGILGAPKVYAQGEPIRNFFRYILP